MLLLVTCTSTLLRAWFSLCMDMHLKPFRMHKILCTRNHDFWRPDYHSYYYFTISFICSLFYLLIYLLLPVLHYFAYVFCHLLDFSIVYIEWRGLKKMAFGDRFQISKADGGFLLSGGDWILRGAERS